MCVYILLVCHCCFNWRVDFKKISLCLPSYTTSIFLLTVFLAPAQSFLVFSTSEGHLKSVIHFFTCPDFLVKPCSLLVRQMSCFYPTLPPVFPAVISWPWATWFQAASLRYHTVRAFHFSCHCWLEWRRAEEKVRWRSEALKGDLLAISWRSVHTCVDHLLS